MPARRAGPQRLAVAAALLLASPLVAQQADSARADSAAADSTRAHRLAPQVVTGTRLSDASERTPGQVDPVPLGAAPPGPGAAAAAVARLPGVSLFDDQGSRAQPSLNVRGFTLSPVVGVPQGVSVFLDGVRINEPDAQQVNFDLVPTDAIARAELVRGPSALFGKNTLAGALLLFTERGDPAAPRLEAEAEAGAFGYRGARVTAGGARGGTDGFLLARASDEDGYRDGTPATTRMVFGTLGRRGGDETRDAAVSVMLARDRIYQAGSLPESWLRANRRANYTGGDFFAPDLAHVTARGARPILGGVARGNLFARRNAVEQFNVNVDNPDTRAFVTNRSAGGTVELSRPLHAGSLPLALTFGGEYARNDVAYRIYRERPSASRELDERARVKEDDAALFAQGVLDVGARLSAAAALRGDYVRVPFRDLKDPANDGTSVFRRLSPRVGATYRFSPTLRAYASVSSGFRAAAALELACARESAPCPLPFSLGDDPPLEPVSVWNYEGGLDWEAGSRATLELSAYRADVRNEIVFVASQSAAGFFENIPRTRRDGAELTGTLRLTAGLRAIGSYSLLSATYRSAVRLASADTAARPVRPGDRFPLSPTHRGTLGLQAVRVLQSLVLDGELSARAVSSQYLRGDESNRRQPLGGYAVADLRLSAEHTRFGVSASLTNLFDRDYQSFGVYGENPKGPPGGPRPAPGEASVERFLTPGYPRSLTVSVTLKR